METAIRKQITILMNRVTVVNYVQGTDVIPIEFEIMDYPLPTDTEARIYIHKPSKAIIYNMAAISGQKITITPTTQMFAEVGENTANIEVIGRTNGKKLATFPVIFRVAPNFRDEGALESKDEYEALIYYMKLSMSYAVGGSGIREGEATDNSKYYRTQARSWATGDTGERDGEKTDNAKWYSTQSDSYAKGGTGMREGEDTDNASYYRTQSKSWAVGGTGERDGEDTDNSMWWETMSESYANGKSGKRDGEATDNSKYYMTQAHSYAEGGTGERTGEDSDNSKYYSEQSAKSAAAAKVSETNAKESETNAKASETNAKTSETNAKSSETAAGKSASAASASQNAAKTSETNAASSASTASAKASDAAASASSAKTSETNAASSAKTATERADAASSSADKAASSETSAASSASAAKTSETNAKASADLAAARAQGGLKPVGTITFAQLPTSGQTIGDMYNISDSFTTTASFEEGAGKSYAAGSNVYWTKNSKWDVLGGINVIGVKGDAETTYRTGNVNLTAANVGALASNGTATAAQALTTSAGSDSTPVYFKDGKPVACTSISGGVSKTELLSMIYPVGSIYMSVNNVSPATFLGGTWEQIKDKFLLSAGDTYEAGSEGGEATHTLTTDEMPSHSHTVDSHSHSIPALSGSTNNTGSHSHKIQWKQNKNDDMPHNRWYACPDYDKYDDSYMSSAGAHQHTVTTTASTSGNSAPGTSSIGGGKAHNNLPPYLAVYIWKRTA